MATIGDENAITRGPAFIDVNDRANCPRLAAVEVSQQYPAMEFEVCKALLLGLIANADPRQIAAAEKAIVVFAASLKYGDDGLKLIQQDVLAQCEALDGPRRAFVDLVNAYIDEKLKEREGRKRHLPPSRPNERA